MGERRNTIRCAFDLESPRISAYEIHEWIYEQLKLEDNEVVMVQNDGSQRHVCILNYATITGYRKCCI